LMQNGIKRSLMKELPRIDSDPMPIVLTERAYCRRSSKAESTK